MKKFIYSVSLSVFCFQALVCNLCRLYLMLTTPPLRPSNKLILHFIFFSAPYKTTGPCTSHVTPSDQTYLTLHTGTIGFNSKMAKTNNFCWAASLLPFLCLAGFFFIPAKAAVKTYQFDVSTLVL